MIRSFFTSLYRM